MNYKVHKNPPQEEDKQMASTTNDEKRNNMKHLTQLACNSQCDEDIDPLTLMHLKVYVGVISADNLHQ